MATDSGLKILLNTKMRDLLDRLQTINESTGLANRKPGEKFKNSAGNELTFQSIEFFPEEGGKYDSENLDQVIARLGPDVKWVNRKPKSGGVAVATFDSDKGPVQYGFYKQQIYPNKLDNKIDNEFDGYKFSSKASEKVQARLTPQDLLIQRDNLTSADIIKQLTESLGADSPLVEVASRIANGEKFPLKFADPGVSDTAFRDYFCEILQPIALQTGQFKGNAGEAAETFLGGSFADTVISFDAAKNAGLSDSIMTNSQGKSIKISTKGGVGAQASAKNLVDSVNELNETPAGKKLVAEYNDVIELIKVVQQKGQYEAPLYLGVKFNVISDEDADQVKKLRGLKPISLDQINGLNLSDNLKKLAQERKTDNPQSVNLFYHLLAAIAFKAAEKVNDKTDFSKAATDILNNGALVQVYTNLKAGKSEWVLELFDTKWPSNNIKGVLLSASKNYFSTGVKGNFTFKIDRGGKKDAEPNMAQEPQQTATPDLPLAAKTVTEPRMKRKQMVKPAQEPTRDLGPAGRSLR